jgi:hypothetical protein
MFEVEVIDSNKVKIEDGKPFPLKLLKSKLLEDALEYLKNEELRYDK